jgi:DNA ligase (NAD+)
MSEQKTVFEEMQELNTQITYHADLFFNKDTQEIPNHVYDDMVERWNDLANDHPDIAELFEVHNKPVPIHEATNEGLLVIKFDMPMLSMKKALTHDQFFKWQNNLKPDTAFFYEIKLDGLALELLYVMRKLVGIYTRGDGLEGEDVTHALPLFCNIQETLPEFYPDEYRVRGEGFISWTNFHLYNETVVKPKATPRNAVSGWVRALAKNQDKNARNLLTFCVYWSSDNLGATSYEDLRDQWVMHGFHPVPQATLQAIKDNVVSRDWPMDGIVAKVNSLEYQQELGEGNKHPNWSIAYKLPFEEGESPLESVEWNTSKTGRVVPVLIYAPIQLGGVMCRRASLDNYKQFVALDLHEDSVLAITRNGDVIPRVNRVLVTGVGKAVTHPEDCPSCGCLLEVRVGKESAELVCNNVAGCPAQLLMRCVALTNKRCLDIDDLGPVKLAGLIEYGIIKAPVDILRMTRIAAGQKIWDRIQEAKTQPLYRVIQALGLPGVDLVRAKKLAKGLRDAGVALYPRDIVQFLRNTDNIQKIPGFSVGLSMPIAVILDDPDFEENAMGMLENLTIIDEVGQPSEFHICITGELGQSREELKEYFADAGIEVTDNLTKDCKFLVVGEKPGNSKVLKATELDIPTVNATKATSIDSLIQHIKGA